MNLVIFTPAIKASAIGRMAALVTRALTVQEHEVTVVRTENENLFHRDTHDFGVTVLSWSDSARLTEAVQRADTVIYQIGDNYEFHQGGLHCLPSLPGLVCLHDFYLGNLFYGWAQSRRADADAILRTWYGDDIACRFFGFANSEAFIENTCNVSPMTEWICSMAQGVITHSGWGCERVLNSCPGPVRVVPLVYDAPGASTSGNRSQPVDNESLWILTIGHINPNKRVESVIRAIGDSLLLRQRVIYRLVGHVEPEVVNSLSTLARNLGVRLVISGEVDDVTLSQAIATSDVISCLRWPSLEAASASAIEAMLYGKPVIVTDTGFYAEIPDQYVLKISPDNEIGDLQSVLKSLLNDESRRKSIGAQGQQWALQTFTAENYACELTDAVEQMLKSRPTLNAVDYFCKVMHQWSENDALLNIKEIMQPLRIFENSPSPGPIH